MSVIRARAVVVSGAGGPEVLRVEVRDVRAPGTGEIRVRVAAAGLNRADLIQRRGHYPAPPGAPADVLGLEHAGTVEAVGPEVTEVAVGDRVMGIVAGGAMCEAVVVHAREVMRVPEGMALTTAAAIPEVFLTAWDALFRRAALEAGQVALIHAATSGVGTAAIQLARHAGATVIGTGRDSAKLAQLDGLGAALDHTVVVSRQGPPAFAAAVREAAGGADVILDGVGAAYLPENLDALKLGGTLVVIGLLAGATGSLPMGALLSKRATVIGSVLRSRPLEEKIALVKAFEARYARALTMGALRPVVADVMPMTSIAAAHQRLEANEVVGKIVMRW